MAAATTPAGVVAWTSAAALGEQHHRHATMFGDVDHAVRFGVVAVSLRPGEHHVVVADQRYPRRRLLELVAVDGTDPDDHPVGRRPSDELLERHPAVPVRHDQRPVFDERVRIEQLRDVLACRLVPAGVPAGNGIGSRFVECAMMPVEHRAQVRTDLVEIDVFIRQ